MNKVSKRYEIIKDAVLEYLILFKSLNNGDSPTYWEIARYIYSDIGEVIYPSGVRAILGRLQKENKIFVHKRSGKSLSILVYGYEWRKVDDGGPDPLRDLRVP